MSGLRAGRLALGAALALLVFVRLADPFGDRGLANVATAGIGAIVLLGLALAFARRRTLPLALRLWTLAGLAGLLALAVLLVRVEGVSGEMVPRLGWRFAGARAPGVPDASSATAPAPPRLGPPGPQDFPAFLGPRRDNALSGPRLARDWEARPPVRRWRAPIGSGWSAFAIAGGWAFTLEQDASGQRASARALDSGALLWSVRVDEPFEHVLGGDGPRATPAVVLAEEGGVDGGELYVHTAWGRLLCLDAQSGAPRWERDLRAEAGLSREREIELAQYGRSASPLVLGELVIVSGGGEPGAPAGLSAYDRLTGERRWSGPPRHFSYSSPSFATLADVPQVLVVNEASLSAHAPEDGRLLWEVEWPGTTSGDANVSQAVPVPPARVFVSKGYGGGGLLLELAREPEGRLVPRELWRDGRILRTKLTNVVRHEGFLYGLDDGTLECVELATGRKRWKEGRYGHGQVLLVGGLLLLCSEEGELLLLEPDPERANAVLGRFRALEGKCWAHLALAGNLLLLRNDEECTALELALE